jgi:hypothetical protein
LPGDKRLSGTDAAIVKVAMLHEQLETAEAEQIHKLTIEHESAIDAKDSEALGNAIA